MKTKPSHHLDKLTASSNLIAKSSLVVTANMMAKVRKTELTLLIVACLFVCSICMATTISTVDCSIQTSQISAIEASSSRFIKPQTLTASLHTIRQTEKETLGISSFKHHSTRQIPIDNSTIEFIMNPGELAPQAEAQVSNKQSPSESSIANQQAAAHALAQEANRAATKLNAELCKNFSIGIQHEDGGSFTSPNYPNKYPLNLVCHKLIEAPVGHYIVLEFRDQFEIEEAGNDCDNDKIEIRDGRYGLSKVLARYCGTNFPREVKSTNEAMWLRFISDASIAERGFKAVYRFEKQKNIKPNPPFECRFNVTAMSSNVPNNSNSSDIRTGIHSGVIKNSDVPDKLIDYTRQFNVSLECIWNITVMPGWKIYLTFSNYELNKPNDCESNFIEIYEENLTEENQTVKFCGTRTEPQQSKSNVFNIRHHALPTASGSRFEIIYTAFRDKGIDGCDAAREFDCDDGTCIHDSLKCDGQVNCKYRYDEASDPGPCLGIDPEGSFFETEHMVIILVVFLLLVGGMCASIIVSCWGKIQERRRRKLEYNIRKSREASMEGQLNRVDSIHYGTNDRSNSNTKQRLTASNSESHNHQTNASLDASQRFMNNSINANNYLAAAQYQNPSLNQMIVDANSTNYGIYGGHSSNQSGNHLMNTSNTSLDTKADGGKDDNKMSNIFGARGKTHDFVPDLNKSLQNVQQSILNSMAAQKGHQVDSNKQQQSVPDVNLNNQYQLQSSANQAQNETLVHNAQQQQMLNLSLARNHLSQQQQQKFISSIYQPQHHDNNNNNNNNSISNSNINNNSMAGSQYSRYLRHQRNAAGGITSVPGGILSQSASAQTMPISLANYNMIQAQLGAHITPSQAAEASQSLNYDTNAGSQLAPNAAYNPQRALTLSTMHQPHYNNNNNNNHQHLQQQRNLQAIYGVNPQLGQPLNSNNLSSSVSCCNVLGDCINETPLISDLIARANQQRAQAPQNNRIYELRSWTMGPRMQSGAGMPRSISAHQLSKSQLRQSQTQSQNQNQNQSQLQQLHLQQQQHQQQQQQLSFKSMSDAGHVIRHQPPNHSLSYPHACTAGSHLSDQRRGGDESPTLPPPPPPPNLVQVRSSTSCAAVPPSSGQQIDTRRAAFKVSRLDASQLTGDTLQDADLMVANLPLGSMQFDEPSTESDATFGMLMNSIGNTSLNLGNLSHIHSGGPSGQQICNQQQPPVISHQIFMGQNVKKPPYPQQQLMLTHLSECNFVRNQRSNLINRQEMLPNQPLICDCGALERANQMRQQQLHQAGSSHEFDDSDDGACIIQASPKPGSFANMDVNNLILSQNIVRSQLKNQHSNVNGSIYGRQQQQQQQQQYARFRHQSSESTADHDDEDEEEIDGYNLDPDDEVSSDALPIECKTQSGVPMKVNYRARSVIRNEELRDGSGKHLSGSRTSISCQSCTCGSQLQLDQVGVDDDSSNSKSVSTNQPTAIDIQQVNPQQNSKSSSGNSQLYGAAARLIGGPAEEGAKVKIQNNDRGRVLDTANKQVAAAEQNCDTKSASGGNSKSQQILDAT